MPTEIAPGPRQNKVDILNWREDYVLLLNALTPSIWQGEMFILMPQALGHTFAEDQINSLCLESNKIIGLAYS